MDAGEIACVCRINHINSFNYMRNNILNASKCFVVLLLMLGAFFSACDESIDLAKLDEASYEVPGEVIGYITNNGGDRKMSFVDFRDKGTEEIYVGLTEEAPEDVTVSFRYEPSLLDAYNSNNDTEYQLFPVSAVTIPGKVTIAKGGKVSGKGEVVFETTETLEKGRTYVIPLKAELASGNVGLSEAESEFLIFVDDLSKIPTADKPSGIKIISCMEVNDTNPLNNLCFTLADSGKPLIDMVILFSANINYNNETGKVFVYNNPNVQHLLDNREKYLKPLQDRGIQVVLGILGNHDHSGVANLGTEAARQFAQELKVVCDAYRLDGVFFDDEYSSYKNPPPPGFVTPSNAAAARLCYETKMAMPDKLVTVYVYSRTSSLPAVDGHDSGTFIDYAIHDYGGSYDLSGNYPGLPRSGMALYSQEYARGYTTSETNLKSLRDGGYGAHMIFAMDPFRRNFSYSQKPSMERIARALFDDELVYDGKPYKKDW